MITQQHTLTGHWSESLPSTIHISGKCNFRDEGDLRVIFSNGIPLLSYAIFDKAAEHYAMIHLVESGLATQQEVSSAFGCSRQTIFRAQKKYDEGGMEALVPKKKGPKEGTKVTRAKQRRIVQLKDKGLTNVAIGVRLGLKESTVRKALKRTGWSQPKGGEETVLPFAHGNISPLEAEPAAKGLSEAQGKSAPEITIRSDSPLGEPLREPTSYDSDPMARPCLPAGRSVDRAMACLGLLEDAAPLFQSASNIPFVGVLLAIPALVASGIFAVAERAYGSLGPSFYGLRTTFLTLLFMALLRIKRPEGLKEYSPAALGRLLGLDRVCEVKTLRRKLACLAAQNKAISFGCQLAQARLKMRQEALGFLYVDGHVRVYNGKRKLAKAYVTQRRLVMPATTDYWVNDEQGGPVFVVTAVANEGLVKMLLPVLAEVRALVGDGRSLTVVFDRGGWSPKLFGKLIGQGFDLITYRKGTIDPIPPEYFSLMAQEIEGKRIEYFLHERTVAFSQGALWLRQISRLNPSGHQTHIVTSRQDLSPVTIAYRMFERWRQENFFKYMAEEYALDALVDYGVEPDDLERLVPNPKRKEISQERKRIRAELRELESRHGLEAVPNQDSKRPTIHGSKIANAAMGQKIELLRRQELEIKWLYRETPTRVPVKETLDGQTLFRLNREKKHLTNLIKMVAYQTETDLLSLIRPQYARADDEGRTLIQSAMTGSGDMEVTGKELRVILNPLSSPHRTEAIRHLCQVLNSAHTLFPGSQIRLVYDVKEHGHVA